MNIGVFLPNWVGDACMTTPLFRELRNHPQVDDIIGIGRWAPIEVLRGSPWIDSYLGYRGKSWKERMNLVRKIRERKLDTILLLTNSFSSGLMALMSGAKRRIGYARPGRKWMLTEKITDHRPRDRSQGDESTILPEIDAYLALGELMGCSSANRRMELHLTPEDRVLGEQVWEKFSWNSKLPTILINSTGAYGSSKVWPEANLVELCKQLDAKGAMQVLLHCGPSERQATNQAADSVGSANVRSLGEFPDLPLGLSKAVIERSTVVISTDSGPRHIAAALDRPVISLFGPTNPNWTQTYNRPEKILYLKLPCQPCYARTCPLKHHHCMKNISVERVFRETMLEIERNCSPASSEPPLSEVA